MSASGKLAQLKLCLKHLIVQQAPIDGLSLDVRCHVVQALI